MSKSKRELRERYQGFRKATVFNLAWSFGLGGAAFALLVSFSPSGTSSLPAQPVISFSNDYQRATISYDKGTWTFHRPVVPSSEFPVLGKVFWVAPDGSDSNNGSEEKPFKTINKGVSVVRPGDIVYIKAGTYVENLKIDNSGQMDKPIVISAAPGEIGNVKITPPEPFVEANPNSAVVELSGSHYVWINGLVIEGARGRPEALEEESFGANGITWKGGAGFGCRATNNVIYNNLHCGLKELGHGGTNISMEGNIIFENGTDTLDHGIYAPSDDTRMIGNIIFNNSGYGIHSYRAPSRHVISHNLIFGNGFGGILLAADYSEVYHNVSAFHLWGLIYYRGGSAYNSVTNNIFAFNKRGDAGADGGGGDGLPHHNSDDYNCFTKPPDPNIPPGPNEIVADPGFVDAKSGDFRLTDGSPCVDRGAYVGLPFQGSAPDLGVGEHRPAR